MGDMALEGMKAIEKYMNLSEDTILKRIREYDFPARKCGGIYVSDKEEIDQWRKRIARGEILRTQSPEPINNAVVPPLRSRRGESPILKKDHGEKKNLQKKITTPK